MVAHLGLYVSSVVVLMWCTSVSYPVVFDWSVNELQACVGQTISVVCLMVMWHCVSFSRECRGCKGHDRLEKLRPDVGSG